LSHTGCSAVLHVWGKVLNVVWAGATFSAITYADICRLEPRMLSQIASGHGVVKWTIIVRHNVAVASDNLHVAWITIMSQWWWRICWIAGWLCEAVGGTTSVQYIFRVQNGTSSHIYCTILVTCRFFCSADGLEWQRNSNCKNCIVVNGSYLLSSSTPLSISWNTTLISSSENSLLCFLFKFT
jgi:hypothetical protein